jgi:predicted phosphodiesterase
VAQLQPEGFWLINPGTVSGVHNKATYAVGEIRDGELTVQIKEL